MTEPIPDRNSPGWDAWAAEHPLHRAVVGPKANPLVMEQRISLMIHWLGLCMNHPTIVRKAAAEWGVTTRTAETVKARAIAVIRAHYDQDRSEHLCHLLHKFEAVAERAMEQNQLAAAVGALSGFAKFARLDPSHDHRSHQS